MTVLRDMAIMLLIAEMAVFALAPLVVLGGLIYGMGWLQKHDNLPTWLQVIRAYVDLVVSYVELAMGIVAKPVLLVKGVSAAVQEWLEKIVPHGGDE